MELSKYGGIALFRDANAGMSELRVVMLDASSLEDAAQKSLELMNKYAADFDMQFDGVNVYECDMDSLKEDGEVFSMTWESDSDFDRQLEHRIGGD